MGIFDWLLRPKAKLPLQQTPLTSALADSKPIPTLPQLCYDVAYFLLPYYAYKNPDKIADLCLNTPTAAGPFFYVMAAQSRKVEPDIEIAKRFKWHHGELAAGCEYFVLEYPVPPSIDLSDLSIEEISSRTSIVLAPYFSAIIRTTAAVEVRYFIIGQSPVGGGTTLRCIQNDSANCNLGPGPKPELSAFLDAIRSRITAQN